MNANQEGPGEAAVAALGQATQTPERLWNMSMAMTTAEELATLAANARLAQVSTFHASSDMIKGGWSMLCCSSAQRAEVRVCSSWAL